MKRIITFLIGLLIAVSITAQNKHDFNKVVNAKEGITIGTTADTAKISKVTTDGTNYKVYRGSTQLAPYIPDGSALNKYVTLQADTGSVTFTIGGGTGLKGSQPSFLPGARLGGFTNPFPHDTLYIVSAIFHVVQDSGTVTMGFKFFKHATQIPTAASTDMMSAEITLSAATSATTTGTVINLSSTPHFDVYALYPGESVAAIVTTKSNGNMPVWMDGTISCRKQNLKY